MRFFKRITRILLLVILVLFAVQLVDAKLPVPNRVGHYAAAQQVPPRGTAKAVPPAEQRPETAPAETAAPAQGELAPDIQNQLNDLQHQFEQEAVNRMRYGRPNYGLGGFMGDLVPFLVFVGVTLALIWILRTVLDNRRWYRMVKVQTDTHAKLLDRFASSQEMLAYVQSDAGKKFLEMPIFESQRRQVSSLPFGRILWSVQIGIIAAVFGAGILFLRGRVSPDADMGFQVFGTLVLTLGIGFIVSGGVSYFLAKHFGLLEQRNNLAHSERNA
ncbi:MAG TPA: hypothetical protein VMF66_03080 [Candidatus Acidoferrum sp.]|nr:hypothetical protein [Candidatus Acidoferrum sp.]